MKLYDKIMAACESSDDESCYLPGSNEFEAFWDKNFGPELNASDRVESIRSVARIAYLYGFNAGRTK